MKHLDSTYDELIIRYLSGNADNSDVASLEKYVSQSAENRAYFKQMKKAYLLGGLVESSTNIDIEQAWTEVANKTIRQTPVVSIKNYRPRRMLRIAAVFAALAVVGFLLVQQLGTTGREYVATTISKTISLPDGSEVVLNRNSTLTYTTDELNRRLLALSGDAYFDVMHMSGNPFIVSTEGTEVEVLGTSFYVDAQFNPGTVEVSVASGKVAVRAVKEEVILTSGEKAVHNKNRSELTKKLNENENFNAIKTKKLVYQNAALSTVTSDLKRVYGVDVRVAIKDVRPCEISTTFENKSIDAILQILESSLGINVTKNKNNIILQGNCTLN